mmetsp:Transcript_17906/g.55068  ORF Transcript_17906/g.55068 Transcript_17906/m.55068 type:complete len:334 (+) Transcript_17906:148-1149(+)
MARAVALVFIVSAAALQAPRHRAARSVSRAAATLEEPVATKADLLPRERYIASNRFKTRGGKAAAKFEARWANRKSRLATLDGFRYFSLFRQVPLEDVVGERGAAAMGGNAPSYDYMSFTIWDDKKAFNAWRKGDAFKEAHGGTSIAAFLKAMVSSLRVLKGAPSPVFYDGLLHLAAPPSADPAKAVEGGWRVVEADGKNLLEGECFVAANRFAVRPGAEAAFEERWAQRDSSLAELPGFKSFTMLRRDGGGGTGHGAAKEGAGDAFGDDFNYMSFTIWENKEAFGGWRNSQSFKDAHSSGPKKEAGAPPPWVRPPSVAFWEGVLELTCAEGA